MAPLDEYRLEVEGVDATFRVLRARREEAVHRPFSLELAVRAEDGDGMRTDIDEAALVAAKATLAITQGDRERTLQGVVDRVESVGDGFVVTLVPVVALLADAIDHQVFVGKDAIDIIEEVLSEHGLSVAKRVARSLAKRPQCVQAFESDLAFVSRLAAEEGLTWFLPENAADEIVFVDKPGGYEDLPGEGPLPVRERGGLSAGASVFDARLSLSVTSDRVALGDYDFEKPQVDLGAKSAGAGARERFEFPGGYREPKVGSDLAALRLEQYRARERLLVAKTASRRLVPGYVVALDDPERDELSGRWLVIEVREEVRKAEAGQDEHACEFVAVPAEGGHRVPRAEAPTLGGVQTAVVTGASGAEVAPDSYGRITVLHRWDRRRPQDDTSSAFHRVVQPPLSGGFMQPRVGWEVLLGFRGASGDEPVVLGRLYTAVAPPPSSLPGKKVVSAFGSLTTPGGGGANLIETDDTAGNEAMNFVASKDWNERTENDKNTAITADDTWTVSADRTLIVGQVLSKAITGAESYSIGGSRTVNVTSNLIVNAASESVMIGGVRTFDVGGDYRASSASLTRLVGAAKAEAAIEHSNRAVKGASTVVVGGSWNTVAGASANVSVLGASTELVSGVKSIQASRVAMSVKGVLKETLASRSVKAGGNRTESFGAAGSYSIGGPATLKGSEITVTAKSKITLKAGGVTITITPGSIKIAGDVESSTGDEDKGEMHYG